MLILDMGLLFLLSLKTKIRSVKEIIFMMDCVLRSIEVCKATLLIRSHALPYVTQMHVKLSFKNRIRCRLGMSQQKLS